MFTALLALPLAAQLVMPVTPDATETTRAEWRGEVAGSDQNRRARRRPVDVARPQECETNPARIVDDIYQQVLERPADEASAGMAQALASGRMSVRDIVAQVAKSEEHGDRYFWHPLVMTLYRQVLKREPNQQELQEMTSDLAAGRAGLPEVIARAAKRAANSDEEAVRILYRRLLGREADPQGLQGFTDLARREGIETVARDIVASPEYRQRAGVTGLPREDATAYEAAVRSLYRHVLARDPDPAGLQDLTMIAVARGFDAVVDRMVSSREYERLYGTDTVPGRGLRYCGA